MKWFVFLFLFGTAYAGTPMCYPWEANGKEADIALFPANPVVWLSVEGKKASFSVSWWCRDRYQWHDAGFFGYKDNLHVDWVSVLTNLRTMSHGQLDDLWVQGVKCYEFTSDLCRTYVPLRTVYAHQLEATRPPPILWAVKDNIGKTDRPVFRSVDKIRNIAAVAAERVSDVATLCDCITLAIEESGGTYCSVAGKTNVISGLPLTSDRVSLCEEKPAL